MSYDMMIVLTTGNVCGRNGKSCISNKRWSDWIPINNKKYVESSFRIGKVYAFSIDYQRMFDYWYQAVGSYFFFPQHCCKNILKYDWHRSYMVSRRYIKTVYCIYFAHCSDGRSLWLECQVNGVSICIQEEKNCIIS